MLTFIESISLAGDRTKQNDDACGATRAWGWVIDGATDLGDTPLTAGASDAAWIAQYLNRRLYEPFGNDPAAAFTDYSRGAAELLHTLRHGEPFERWQSPICSVLMLIERGGGTLHVTDLGDCRVFVLDAEDKVHIAGGPPGAADNEAERAAQQTDAHKPLLERTETIARLRAQRAAINREGAEWTFGLDPACGEHVRMRRLDVKTPAHVLLMTDGFSALVDRYRAYDPAGLVRAAMDRGLHELGRELRAIETADLGGAKHPRFKASDDATALLMRMT